ncbi:MAG: hypothetical protein ACE148_01160 [Vicinamibacterales bacterium]
MADSSPRSCNLFHAGDTERVASADQQCLYRVSGLSSIGVGGGCQPRVERLLTGTFGRIGTILDSENGLFFATANGSRDDAGRPTATIYLLRQREFSDLPVPRRAAVR